MYHWTKNSWKRTIVRWRRRRSWKGWRRSYRRWCPWWQFNFLGNLRRHWIAFTTLHHSRAAGSGHFRIHVPNGPPLCIGCGHAHWVCGHAHWGCGPRRWRIMSWILGGRGSTGCVGRLDSDWGDWHCCCWGKVGLGHAPRTFSHAPRAGRSAGWATCASGTRSTRSVGSIR